MIEMRLVLLKYVGVVLLVLPDAHTSAMFLNV
jgi:hypothetical protein